MKVAITVAMVLAVAFACGCSGMMSGGSSPQGGGIGKDEGFKIGTPMSSVKMKQNETRTVKIALKRGKFFRDEVTLQTRATEGITVEPAQVTVKSSDPAEVMLLVSASKDTPLGEHRVYVKGMPQSGESTTAEVKISVAAP